MVRIARGLRAAISLTAALPLVLMGAQSAAAVDAQALEWPLQTLQADKTWTISRGAGITVAVIDSGVEAGLPDLAGQVVPGTSFTGNGSPIGWSDPSSIGHGTGMASIIAANGASNNGRGMLGLAPGAKIMPIAVSDAGGAWTDQQISRGITYAVDHGAQVINISLGLAAATGGIETAVSYALQHNVVIVAGVGNYSGQPVEYPAAYPGVIAASAVDVNGQFWASSCSGPQVTVAAPGVSVVQLMASGQYAHADGTSGSAAYTSAAVALLRSKYPFYTVGQIEDLLIHTADRKSAATHDDQYGYGIIDPYAALTTTYVPAVNANPLGIGTDTDSAAPTSYFTPGQVVPGPPVGTEGPGAASQSPVSSPAAAAGQGGGSSGMGMVLGVVGGVVVVAGAAAGWVAWRRRRNVAAAGGPPPGPPEQPPAPPPGFVGGPPRW